MKTLCTLLALALLPLCVHAQRQGQNQIGPTLRMDRFYDTSDGLAQEAVAQRQLAVELNQWRVVRGETGRVTDPGWARLAGNVLQNVSGGMMVMGNGERIFLERGPRVADDLPFTAWAKDTGELYQYNTVGGSTKSIRRFDCGIVLTSAPVVLRAEPVRVLSPEEKLAQNDRVLKYQMENAEKGLPSFQVIMGRRHLTGDGVPRDPVKAREFFDKAAAQGDTDAKSALTNFPTLFGGN